jgi:hypothetical protein
VYQQQSRLTTVSNLHLEPLDLPGEGVDGALLHVRVWRAVDRVGAERLLEEADDGRWAA